MPIRPILNNLPTQPQHTEKIKQPITHNHQKKIKQSPIHESTKIILKQLINRQFINKIFNEPINQYHSITFFNKIIISIIILNKNNPIKLFHEHTNRIIQ